jgi:hypothetical protein
MNTLEVLRYGTQVRMSSVDEYGFNGRENHPEATDVGFVGIVVGNQVDYFNPDDSLTDTRTNVLGGTEVPREDNGPYAFVCYKVRASDGRELDLMDHEIEVLS